MYPLKDKVALITGAANGIGLALAQGLAKEGCRVILTDNDTEALAAAQTTFDVPVLCLGLDVTDREQWEATRQRVEASYGCVDILCNNAGIGPDGQDLLDTDLAIFTKIIDINVYGVLHGIQTFGPAMRERQSGHILNVASMAGLLSSPQFGAYSPSKFAVVALSETLRAELENDHVGVTVFCPGFCQTQLAETTRKAIGRAAGAELLERGMAPEVAVETALRAIKNNWLYALSHQEFRLPLQDRMEELIDAFSKHRRN